MLLGNVTSFMREPQVLCVNDELKMGKGKIAAQCGHGVAGIFTKYRKKQPVAFQQWDMLGGAKIALKVPSTKELVSRLRPSRSP